MPHPRLQSALAGGSQVALLILKAVHAAADCCPPLKSAAGVTLHIAALAQDFRTNQKEWCEFGSYVQEVVACVVQHISKGDISREELRLRLEQLVACLNDFFQTIHALQRQSRTRRFFKFSRNPGEIAEMKKKLDDILRLFHLDLSITAEVDIAQVLRSVQADDIARIVEMANSKLADRILYSVNLEKLSYVKGASWNENRSCLKGTRVSLLDDIMNWTTVPENAEGSEIFLLTGVAGSGKSSVAHSVSQRCFDRGILMSSFFFNRDIAGLNSPSGLVTTIAHDLSRLSSTLAKEIALAIEQDPGLPTAHSLSLQFQKLILEPIQRCAVNGPLVVVVDALDEGQDDDLLRILRDEVPRLPAYMRFFITSRPDDNILRLLLRGNKRRTHFHQHHLDVHDSRNEKDVVLYVDHRLREIAVLRDLGTVWPYPQLQDQLVKRAEGLFIWASTVLDYMGSTLCPDETLKTLLSDSALSLPPSKKMDELYATILRSCNWDDLGFMAGYPLVMGTMMAAKLPLSLHAIQALHPETNTKLISGVLSALGSLLSLPNDARSPIQVLHLSFREFLTVRAHPPFFVDEKQHSQLLATSCFEVLNRVLSGKIPGTGYLINDSKEPQEIPVISTDHVSEEVWYACRFWSAHASSVCEPVSDRLRESVKLFVRAHLVKWLEIVASMGAYYKVIHILDYLENTCSIHAALLDDQVKADFSRALHHLATRLSYMARRSEALECIEEAVQLRRRLAAKDPAVFTVALVSSLIALSPRFAVLDQHEQALEVILEAVELGRKLAKAQPDVFSSELATSLNTSSSQLSFRGRKEDALKAIQEACSIYRKFSNSDKIPEDIQAGFAQSLNNLSQCLTDLGRRDEALESNREAVERYRALITESSSLYTPNLSTCLNNLSICLSELGRRDEALAAAQEAVTIRRKLVADWPAPYTGGLAMTLDTLSSRLSEVGRLEEGLQAARESVELYRQMTLEHPSAFNADFARSLNNLSNILSGLGHDEEALMIIQESYELYIPLSASRPATFNPLLARALTNLSSCLSSVGRKQEALDAIMKGVALYRQLVTIAPTTGTSELAMSLNNLSALYADIGEADRALETIREASGLYRELAVGNAATFQPQFATSLYNLSDCLSAKGLHEAALTAIQQAVSIYQKLASEFPAAYGDDLKDALEMLSTCQSKIS